MKNFRKQNPLKKKMNVNILTFVKYWFPVLIFLFGTVGNILGCIVIWSPKLANIGPQITYKFLFITDTLYLMQIIVTYLQFGFDIYLVNISDLICKLCTYFNYSLAVVSPCLLSYISIDRYVSIKYPAKRFSLRKTNTQIIFFMIVFIYNSIYYLPVFFISDFKAVTNTTTNSTNLECVIDRETGKLIYLMDMFNRVIIPFGLMLISSILLIRELFKSRTRIVENFLAEENKTFYSEIRLATTCICLNIIYILFNLPISIIDLFYGLFTVNLYMYFYYLFYFSYAINFIVLFISNSLFQNEFFNIFKIK